MAGWFGSTSKAATGKTRSEYFADRADADEAVAMLKR
jgi:hypothetical protein